ncbi:hypothetical protein MRX96_010575 [Rhipicephalus microplus]
MGRKLSTMLDRLHPDRAPEKSTRARVRPLWKPDAPGEQPTPVVSCVPPQEGGTVPLTVPVEANDEPLVPPLGFRRSQRARGTPHYLRDYVLALADC